MVPNGYFVSSLHIYIPVKVRVTERGRSSKFISVPLARMVTSPPVPNLLRLKMCFYFRGIEQRRWLGNERWISHPKCLPEREMYEYSSAHFWHIGNIKSALNIWMSSIHLGAFPLFKKFPYNILGRLFIKNLKAFLKCNQLSILLQICTYIITYIKKSIPKTLSLLFPFYMVYDSSSKVQFSQFGESFLNDPFAILYSISLMDCFYLSLSAVLIWVFLSY